LSQRAECRSRRDQRCCSARVSRDWEKPAAQERPIPFPVEENPNTRWVTYSGWNYTVPLRGNSGVGRIMGGFHGLIGSPSCFLSPIKSKTVPPGILPFSAGLRPRSQQSTFYARRLAWGIGVPHATRSSGRETSMKRSARMLAGLGFLFVAWARCGADGAKCNGIWRRSGNCPRR
jgi:hypothetical protein